MGIPISCLETGSPSLKKELSIINYKANNLYQVFSTEVCTRGYIIWTLCYFVNASGRIGMLWLPFVALVVEFLKLKSETLLEPIKVACIGKRRKTRQGAPKVTPPFSVIWYRQQLRKISHIQRFSAMQGPNCIPSAVCRARWLAWVFWVLLENQRNIWLVIFLSFGTCWNLVGHSKKPLTMPLGGIETNLQSQENSRSILWNCYLR